ncbi:MAG TPA: acylneuraminate cytidylyltransferase [Anaerolineales bacterium]|nr:acylneuraminate cytidylyltransferase [Anaerolineales bacterium]
MSILTLIPARGGSKSIPRKNLKLLGGHPLIAWSIAAGLQADCKPRVIVSTDDEEIAAVAREYGAEVPFMRPAELAEDRTLDLPVFQHALRWLAEHEGRRPEIVVQLRPTSPFRPAGMVDEAVRILRAHPGAASVRGVVPSGQNPYKMWHTEGDGPMQPLLETDIDEAYNRPRQDLPPTFWQTGHIDAIRPEVILSGSMSGTVIYPLHIDPKYTVDLDTLLDWDRAEWRLRDPEMDIVHPTVPGTKYQAPPKRPLPEQVALIVFDFDGVMTDNTAWVDENGLESVQVSRSDGMGVELLQKTGIPMLVFSSEPNPVVAARSRKLGLPVVQGIGIGDKGVRLAAFLSEEGIDPAAVVYVGNDLNDLPCFPLVGCAVAVADSHPDLLAAADIVLSKPGGRGAVRELADLVLNHETHHRRLLQSG